MGNRTVKRKHFQNPEGTWKRKKIAICSRGFTAESPDLSRCPTALWSLCKKVLGGLYNARKNIRINIM